MDLAHYIHEGTRENIHRSREHRPITILAQLSAAPETRAPFTRVDSGRRVSTQNKFGIDKPGILTILGDAKSSRFNY